MAKKQQKTSAKKSSGGKAGASKGKPAPPAGKTKGASALKPAPKAATKPAPKTKPKTAPKAAPKAMPKPRPKAAPAPAVKQAAEKKQASQQPVSPAATSTFTLRRRAPAAPFLTPMNIIPLVIGCGLFGYGAAIFYRIQYHGADMAQFVKGLAFFTFGVLLPCAAAPGLRNFLVPLRNPEDDYDLVPQDAAAKPRAAKAATGPEPLSRDDAPPIDAQQTDESQADTPPADESHADELLVDESSTDEAQANASDSLEKRD